jgi:hypothetical protein
MTACIATSGACNTGHSPLQVLDADSRRNLEIWITRRIGSDFSGVNG